MQLVILMDVVEMQNGEKMYTSVELLDMVKARHRLPSDYAAAKLIGCTQQCVSRIRNNLSFFGADNALVLATLLDFDPFKTVASVQLEAARKRHDERVEKLWEPYAA